MKEKPTIFLDIDGVLQPFLQEAIRDINIRYKCEFDYMNCVDSNYFDRTLRQFNQEAYDYFIDKILMNPKFFAGLSPSPGSMSAVERLGAKYIIWGITARHKDCAEATIHRFQELYPAIGNNIFFTSEKLKALLVSNAKAYVEDSAEYAKSAASANIPTFLVDAPYNKKQKENKNLIRVQNIVEVSRILLEDNWYERHF